ncbi:hypothetical protein NECAME_11207 [Necator americanus]|uniref:Diphtheria toxin resistance protein 2 n=1 Tax=Necator americanus TaxID=51031 RepID=W2T6H3_NECAM|nr:hypothetical protein NECAME_11207 [Necator americanus]ETN77229.1 hypothetical protein NECAME_11207 [Necator americanus]
MIFAPDSTLIRRLLVVATTTELHLHVTLSVLNETFNIQCRQFDATMCCCFRRRRDHELAVTILESYPNHCHLDIVDCAETACEPWCMSSPMTDGAASVAQFYSNHTPKNHPDDNNGNSSDRIIDLLKGFKNDELEKFFRLDETVRCCVDEVAASHASCDAIIHYGDACLSALTENIPVKFVFGSFPVNLSGFEEVESYLNASDDIDVLLLTDACYSNNLDGLGKIAEKYIRSGRLFRAVVVDPSDKNACSSEENLILNLGRLLDPEFCKAFSVLVCFVGDPASPLIPLWLMTYPQCSSLLIFDPQTSTFGKHK